MELVRRRRLDLALTEELLNRLDLEPDQSHVRHQDFVAVGPGRPDAQVAAPEPEEDVPEPVVPVLLDGHAGGVVGPLPAADLLAQPDLARGEDDVRPPVEYEC